jgi:hypothetical protein
MALPRPRTPDSNFSSGLTTFKEKKDSTTPTVNVLMPVGLFLPELNHGLSVAAFNKRAELEYKSGKRATKEINWGKVLQPIMIADSKMKAGIITSVEFRKEVRQILDLEKVSDPDFDKDWNAMLGDLSKLKNVLDMLKYSVYKDANIILISGTNPIHNAAISDAVDQPYTFYDVNKITRNPLSLCGFPLYVSYLQKSPDSKLRTSPTNLLDEINNELQLQNSITVLVLSLTSDSPLPDVKKQDETSAALRNEWAKKHGFLVTDYKAPKVIDNLAVNLISAVMATVMEYKEQTKKVSFSHGM